MSTAALDSVSLIFPDGTVAVDDVSLRVEDGEFVVLLGPSGCGKSSILRMIAGLQDPTSGTVILDGRPANHLSPRDRQVAMVFQSYALYPHMTVAANIGFPLLVAGVAPASRDERVAEVVAVLGIDDVLDRMPHQLSGGQQQRVAMARALIRAPRLLLMDEPLSNLDSVLRAGLRAEIVRMARELRITTLYVTHDQVEAQTMADRVAVLRSGRLEDVGRPADLYRNPATLHVAAFLGSPRMSLIRAYVHVVCDSHVGLHVGDQVVYLPWADMRCRVLAHYNGEDVAMGMRADALVPVTSGRTGEVLHGRITHVAHHGHESVASLDVGARTVEVDESSPARVVMPSRASAPSRVRQLLGETLRIGHRAQADPSATAGHGDGRHTLQRNDVTVRVLPYAEVSLGALLSVQLRLDELHFFDLDNGQRIDVRRRS